MATQKNLLLVPFVLVLKTIGFEPMVEKKAKENQPIRKRQKRAKNLT